MMRLNTGLAKHNLRVHQVERLVSHPVAMPTPAKPKPKEEPGEQPGKQPNRAPRPTPGQDPTPNPQRRRRRSPCRPNPPSGELNTLHQPNPCSQSKMAKPVAAIAA